MDPKGMKMTIKTINKVSFPWNLLFTISIMAIIGKISPRITANGIKNKTKSPIIYYLIVL
jgi:hypothetical protein